VGRVVEGLLGAAEAAAAEQAWDRVLDLCEDVLAVEPDNADAAALRAMAERHVGRAIPAAGRRHVAVLFVDMVGSTPMGEALDPEPYLDVVRAYETACRPVIDRYGGHINRFAGDGLIAFFGYPHAHEDDARRATLAGLDALAALRAVSDRAVAEHGVEVAARVGVHSGLVVGDRGGAGWRLRDDAFGPTVNMAARLQSVARQGTVVVSDTVAPLVAGAVELVSRGPHDLAGIPRPVEVFEVVRALEGAAIRPAPAKQPSLVGRTAELADLVQRLGRPATSAVLLRGEAGVGKSRLLEELLATNRDRGGRDLVLQCAPHLVSSALHPLRRPLHLVAGIAADDPAPRRLDKLVGLVERLGLDADDVVPHLAVALSIDTGGRYPPTELAAPQFKEAMLGHLLTVVERLGPLVVAVEDVQWADPTTIELVDRLVRSGRVLVVAAARPTSTWPPPGLPVDVLMAEPLATDEVRRLAAALAPTPLDSVALDEIARRSDGIPLYTTQLVDALTDADADAIPLPLMELLQSRLDALGTAKAVAQVAATIGRDFERAMLRDVVATLTDDPDADRVDGDVACLVGSHLVDVDADDPNRLRFHHALVRDAAYGSQLHRLRPGRHRAVAAVLASRDEAGRPVDAALVAYHHDQAGDAAQAVEAYLVASERAAGSGAFAEALAHIDRADQLLSAVPGEAAVPAELALCLARGGIATSLGGWAAEGAMDDYGRALELCAKASDDQQAGTDSLRALFGIWNWYCTKGDLHQVAEAAAAIERQLALTPVAAGRPTLDACRGVEHFYRGDFTLSRALLERSVAEFVDDDIDDWARWPIPNDPQAAAWAFLAPLRWMMGDADGALAAVDAGIDRSRSLRFPHSVFSEAFVRADEAWLHRLRGDLDQARRAAHDLAGIADRHGLVWWAVVAEVHLAATGVAASPTADAVMRLATASATYRSLGVDVLMPSWLLEQADGYLALGRLEDAARCIDDAFSFTDQHYARPEALRLRALLHSVHDAEDDLRAAFGVAMGQPAPWFAGRVARTYRDVVGHDDPDMVAALGGQ
jgi:class 3 adenylate cyclase/tetratricopeptide (TPR) repeat protein